MKVKIGNKVYDSNDEPIMVILDGTDIYSIANMIGTNYCSYPDSEKYTKDDFKEIKKWMKDI